MNLNIGDRIRHLDHPDIIREIREIRDDGYLWIYPDSPSKTEYLSADSCDPYFENRWALVSPEPTTEQRLAALEEQMAMLRGFLNI